MRCLYLGDTESRYDADTRLGSPPEISQNTGAVKSVLAAEPDNEGLVFRFGSRLDSVVEFIVHLVPVVRLSQYNRLGGALRYADTTGLALVGGNTDSTAGIQIRHVVRTCPQAGKAVSALVLKQDFHAHTASQAPAGFVDSLFPAVHVFDSFEVFCPYVACQTRRLDTLYLSNHFYGFRQQVPI